MLYPPIEKLVEITDSKYALVILAAKRARQLLETKQKLVENPKSHTNVGIALEELYEGKVTYKAPK